MSNGIPKAAKKMKAPGLCIFCGGTGMSKEHIWSDWITSSGATVPQQTHSQARRQVSYNIKKNEILMTAEMPVVHQGSLIQKKKRNVCRVCNNGWMSKAVDRAKPIVLRLMSGEKGALSMMDQEDLALWFAIQVIMAEYTDERTRAITEAERRWIYEHKRIPDGWHMFVGWYEGQQAKGVRYTHESMAAADTTGVDVEVISPELVTSHRQVGYAQGTTQVLEKVILYCFSTNYGYFEEALARDLTPAGMLHFYPAMAEIDLDQPHLIVNDADWQIMTTALEIWSLRNSTRRT